MDFKENIKRKADDLIRKATVLPDIHLNWQTPIEIRCHELNNLESLKMIKVLDVFHQYKKHPAVYYFNIRSKHRGEDLVSALQKFKAQKQRACPKIDKKRSVGSSCLYCGSRKEGLEGRFIQHLGFGSQKTYALQLLHWSNEMNLEVMFHYAWLEPEYKEFTELIESAIADRLKPLVGKLA